MLRAKLGIAPIAWWNDDLEELSDDVSLEECLRQASVAGFTGMETGRRFPMNMDELGPILDRFGIAVCGGWYSGRLLDGDIEAEKDRIRPMMDFFIAAQAPCIVYGEIARAIQGERAAPLATKPRISDDEMRVYGRTMTAFAEWCADEGMPIAYHHHMGAVIETEPEIDGLMNHSGEALRLAYDTGHLAFAGGDGLRVIERYHRRIGHVHAKDVRLGRDGRPRPQPGELPRCGHQGGLHRAGRRRPRFRRDRPPPRLLRLRGLVRRRGGAGPRGEPAVGDGQEGPCGASPRHGRSPIRGRALNRIDGKVAVVTGGTQGVGAAIARLFAKAGAAGIARAVLWVASNDSGMMTGSVIQFDQSVWGGYDGQAPAPAEPLTP